jgi:RimJ/RimL family protein N-acetyltransferase
MRSITTARGEIYIREASPTDAAQFRELRLGALQDSPLAFSADYQKNLHQPLQQWEDMLTMHPDESTIFLAEQRRGVPSLTGVGVDEHELIGMSGIVRGSTPKTRHGATIWGVYMQPEWRGLHIAEELITACLAWAKARRIVIAKLGVAAINQSAVRCYERCGFTIYGTEPRALFHNDSYYDFHMMSCSLETE